MRNLICILSLLVLFGCEKELEMNSSTFKKKIVLNAFIAKDSLIMCHVSTSVSTLDKPQYELINGIANVVLLRNDLPLYNDKINIIDGLFSLPYVAKANSKYEIQVAYGDYNTVKAVDSVPVTEVAFKIDTLIDQGATLKLRFNITDPPGSQKYLLQMTSSGKKLINTDSVYTNYATVFTSNEKLFLTSIRNVALSKSFTLFDDAFLDNQNKQIELVIEKQQYIVEGIKPEWMVLKISCVSETMYEYYLSTLLNTHIYGGPLATITSQKSNVQQGLGVFCFYTTMQKQIKIKY